MFDTADHAGVTTPDHTADGAGVIAGALAAAIDALVAVEVDAVSDSELASAMVVLRRQQSRLAAAIADLTAAFDARRVWADDGSRSAIDWIATRARVPRPQIAGEVRDARRLRTMPTTRTAYANGDLSPAHVRALTRLAGHPRAGDHFPDSEDLLVREAARNRYEDWHRLCAHWRDTADPDGPEQRRARDHALRRFAIHPGLDGIGHPDGYLTPLAAATVGGALDRLERELFDTDWAAAKTIHGDNTTTAHLARTPAQRRHDALVLMAQRAMAAPADAQTPAPLVTVLVDYPTVTGRVCELAGTGTVLAPGHILELLSHDRTLIERVVFDGPNRVRDISTARTFRGTLRRILDLVHGDCDHPTCTTPATRCQADHIIPWSHGGATSIDNGRLACPPHNRWYYQHQQRTRPPTPTPSDPASDGQDPHQPSAPVVPTRLESNGRSPSPRLSSELRPDGEDGPGGSDPLSVLGLLATDTPPERRGPHWLLRLPRRLEPDLTQGDGGRACSVELVPERAEPAGRWREYVGPSLRRTA